MPEQLVCCPSVIGIDNSMCADLTRDGNKITGGVSTNIREYRWMVQLNYTNKGIKIDFKKKKHLIIILKNL